MIAVLIGLALMMAGIILEGNIGAYLLGVATTLLMFGITRYQEEVERKERWNARKESRDSRTDYDTLNHTDTDF